MHMQFSRHHNSTFMMTDNPEKNRLLMDIARTRDDLESAYAGFDNAVDPDLIDCYIFEVNSILKRYKYLLAQAEKMNLTENEDSGLCTEPPVYSLIG